MIEDEAEVVFDEGAYVKYVTEEKISSNEVFGQLTKFKGACSSVG